MIIQELFNKYKQDEPGLTTEKDAFIAGAFDMLNYLLEKEIEVPERITAQILLEIQTILDDHD